MKSASFLHLIKRSIRDTHQYLFRPFSVKKWIALVWVALLAGVLSGSLNFGLREHVTRKESLHRSGIFHALNTGIKSNQLPSTPSLYGDSSVINKIKASSFHDFIILIRHKVSDFWRSGFGKIALVLLIFAFFIIPWLAAHFSFVWFYNVLNRQDKIHEPFRLFRSEGQSLFTISILTNFLFSILVLGAAILAGYTIFYAGSREASILILILLIVSLSFFYWVARDFVVPIMAVEHVHFGEAWKKFVALYSSNRLEFWNYFFLTIFLSFIIGILKILVGAIWMIALFAAAAVLYAVPFLIFNVLLMQLEFVFWSYAILVGVPLLLFAVVSSIAIYLPFSAFHRFFSIYFLSSLESSYKLLPINQNEN